MLTALDLQWVHGGSFVLGFMACAGCSLVVSGLVLTLDQWGPTIGRWLRRGAEQQAERAPAPILDGTAAEDDPMEGAYTVPDMDGRRLRGYRRMLRDMFAERPIRRAPREVPLSPEESRDLWYAINGDKAI